MTSNYDIRTRKVTIAGSASLYERFHEEAHAEQDRESCLPFLVWLHLRQIRLLGYFVTLWVEFDAMRRARRALQKLGLWDQAAAREAKLCLMSYTRRKEL